MEAGKPCTRGWHFTRVVQFQFDLDVDHRSKPVKGRGSPSGYCHPVWCGKTRMLGLPDGKNFEDICNRLDRIPACDRQIDRQTDIHLATA